VEFQPKEATMATTALAVYHPAEAGPMTLELRKQGLENMLEGKLEQGYGIEDRTDTEATLVTRGRRRRHWFGLSRRGDAFKHRITIDERGGRTSRKI
jgi:hypothetical protein